MAQLIYKTKYDHGKWSDECDGVVWHSLLSPAA